MMSAPSLVPSPASQPSPGTSRDGNLGRLVRRTLAGARVGPPPAAATVNLTTGQRVMTERLVRSFADVELRASGDGRTLIGRAVPFDTPTNVGGYVESFARGAFARTIAERGAARVKVLAAHSASVNPIGRATLLREDPAGLHVELRISRTALGDEVLALVADGALDGLSIGFQPVRAFHNPSTSVVERTEVRLNEISVCAFPAYDGARVLAVRSAVTPQQTLDLNQLDLIRRRASLVAALSGVHK